MGIPVYLGLDVVASLATLWLVAFFLVAWRRTGLALHLVLALGFLLLAGSFALVSSSHFDLAGEADAIDALRFVGQTGGAVVLALAYLSARDQRPVSPARVLAGSAAVVAFLAVAFVLLQPAGSRMPSEHDVALVAHVVQTLAFSACALLALAAFRRHPSADRALVPGAFAAWALGKYTWILIDASGAVDLVPLVYVWRFAAIGLLLLALALPARAPRARAQEVGA